jgi:hypothetical protein
MSEKGHTWPELDGRYITNNPSFWTGDDGNRHEVHGNAQGYGNTELPDTSRN